MKTTVQFRARSFDDWKTEDPDPRCGENERGQPVKEHCETCGCLVAAVSVARCNGHFSYWPSRRERRGGK